MKCKNCKREMKECGFKGNNLRYECSECKLRFVPFMERQFGNNFLGYRKWSVISLFFLFILISISGVVAGGFYGI